VPHYIFIPSLRSADSTPDAVFSWTSTTMVASLGICPAWLGICPDSDHSSKSTLRVLTIVCLEDVHSLYDTCYSTRKKKVDMYNSHTH